MPSPDQWIKMRRRADKGFLQYPRMWVGFFKGGVSSKDLKGICHGASLRWAESYYEHNSDIEFWKKYEGSMSNLEEMVTAHRIPGLARGVKFVRTNDREVYGDGKPDGLWEGGGTCRLKGYTINSRSGPQHSVVAACESNYNAKLFDPNLGQFNIPSTHFKSVCDLWGALWNFYDIRSVLVYDIHPTPRPKPVNDPNWDPLDEWLKIDHHKPVVDEYEF